MKKQITESIAIPEGVSCEVLGNKITCKKAQVELSREIYSPKIKLSIKDSKIIVSCDKANKTEFNVIKTFLAHIKNIFEGLDKKFVYKLEACNLHFPMTLKADKNELIINNFLGEKVPRKAEIVKGVEIEVSGQKITISSHNKEAAGQTAANIEKATKIRFRDRRIFQDGIFITEKPGENK